MRDHKYEASRVDVAMSRFAGVACVILSTIGAVGLVVYTFWYWMLYDEPFTCGVFLIIWMALLGWGVGLTFLNMYPTVWIGEDGLYVWAFFRRVFVPWNDVVGVQATFPSFLGHIVYTNRLTPFHRIYSLLYGAGVSPGFLISRRLENREELLHHINQQATG